MDTNSIAAAALFCLLGGVWFWRARRKNAPAANTSAGLSLNSPEVDFDTLASAIAQLTDEMKSIAQKNVEEISSRIEHLMSLIADADRKIALLRSLQQDQVAAAASPPPAPAEAAAPKSAASSPISLEQCAQLLYEKSMDEAEIARRLGVSRGEVRLLLTLQQSRAAGGAG